MALDTVQPALQVEHVFLNIYKLPWTLDEPCRCRDNPQSSPLASVFSLAWLQLGEWPLPLLPQENHTLAQVRPVKRGDSRDPKAKLQQHPEQRGKHIMWRMASWGPCL